MQNKPTVGHCSNCFAKYTFTMKPKEGRQAINGMDKLQQSDFEENYRDVYTILSSGSLMRVSVCKECFEKLNGEIMVVVLENDKIINKQNIDESRLTDEQKEAAKKEIDAQTVVFWTKKEEDVVNKRTELFGDLV